MTDLDVQIGARIVQYKATVDDARQRIQQLDAALKDCRNKGEHQRNRDIRASCVSSINRHGAIIADLEHTLQIMERERNENAAV